MQQSIATLVSRPFSTVIVLSFLVASSPAQENMTITTSSKEALALFLQGRDQFENIHIPAAARLFDQALEKDPDFALANYYRSMSGGGASITRPRLEKAVALAGKVSAGERLQILAQKAGVDGDVAAAKRYLDELLALHPNDKRARYFMAGYYNGRGDVENYITWLRKTIEVDPKFTPVYNQLGYAYKGIGKFKEAEEAFVKQIELAPDIANSYDSYAELLMKWGKFDESTRYYNMAIQKDPQFKTALRGLGLNHLHKGDFKRARESFEKYHDESTLANAKLDAIANIVYSYVHEGNTEAALRTIDRFAQLGEKENIVGALVNAHLWRAQVAVETGQVSEAAGHLKNAATANENSMLGEGARGSNAVTIGLSEAIVLATGKDFAGADKQLGIIRSMVDKRGSQSELRAYHMAAGQVEILKGNYDRALALLKQGPSENPMNMYRMAVAFERKGNSAEAHEMYKSVVHWNWTGFPYAITRPQAMKKMNGK